MRSRVETIPRVKNSPETIWQSRRVMEFGAAQILTLVRAPRLLSLLRVQPTACNRGGVTLEPHALRVVDARVQSRGEASTTTR